MKIREAIERIDNVLSSVVHYDETLEYQLTSDDIEWLEMAKIALNILDHAQFSVTDKEFNGVDAVEVVRCKDCVHAVAPDPHADLLQGCLHCQLYKGDEIRNVWHKYKKYYKDYSVIDSDDYCSAGKRRDNTSKEREE